jgi:hypothetical protein
MSKYGRRWEAIRQIERPQEAAAKARQMICLVCDRIEEAACKGAQPWPDEPIPWGWSWCVGGAKCERCSTSATPKGEP